MLHDLQKKYGATAVMKLTDNPREDVPAVSTGVLSLDLALGIGGFPVGRMIELFGPEMSGKTSMALFHLAEHQKAYTDKFVAFIDMEHTFDQGLAVAYGIQPDRLIISQPNSAEEALNIAFSLVESDAVSCVVIDSVSSLVPEAEVQEDIGKPTIALQARLMSQACRKLAPVLDEHQASIVFINQIRTDISRYGSPVVTSGGKALKFYSSVRVEVRSGEPITEKGVRIGHKVMCKVVKNKCAPPFRICTFNLLYGKGVDRVKELVDICIRANVIAQGGAWLSVVVDGTEFKAQGKDKFAAIVRENQDLFNYLDSKIRSKDLLVLANDADIDDV